MARSLLLWCLASVRALQQSRRAQSRCAPRMAVPSGGKVLAVGNGPVFLLAAKTAARAGYETTIVSARVDLFEKLLWTAGDAEGNGREEPDANLKVLSVSDDADVDAFDAAVAGADALVIAFDAEQTLTDALLDVVLPESGGAGRVALLSKHLSGKGYGPLSAASKAAANKEVWACTRDRVAMYRDFEAKLRTKCAARGAELTIVRCGTLKGGGPGAADDRVEGVPTLSERLYDDLNKDLVNWQLLFDCDTKGAKLTKGDTAEGPGFRAVFTSTASDAQPGDSGRVQVCQALVRSLGRADCAGAEFGVTTAKAEGHLTDAEWDAQFAGVV